MTIILADRSMVCLKKEMRQVLIADCTTELDELLAMYESSVCKHQYMFNHLIQICNVISAHFYFPEFHAIFLSSNKDTIILGKSHAWTPGVLSLVH